MGAILLWATLATLTTLKGPIPPFQTTAIVFTIGAAVSVLVALLRGRLALHPADGGLPGARHLWPVRLPRPLFRGAEAGAARRGAPDLLAVGAADRAVLGPAARRGPARCATCSAALLGLAAAAILVWDQLDLVQGTDAKRLGFALALGCALVWSTYSVASRLLADVPSESIAVSCLATAALAFVCSFLFEQWTMPADRTAWLALLGLGLGPVGAAFLLWDIGMKGGSVPLLGVLSYASPIISTGLLMALGLAAPTWALASPAC